jgi:acetoin utilization protein AcuC
MERPLFFGSQIYRTVSYGGRHPLAIPRVPVAIDLCRALGWLPLDAFRTSPRAKPEALLSFHTVDYLAALVRADATGAASEADRARYGFGTLSNPVFPGMYRRPATSAGGSMMAAETIAAAPRHVFNPGGGTHHGMPDRANGFCYLNDPVLAIQRLLASGLRRVAYVDIDAHHCDGVEAAFAGREDVLMISLHEEARWPFTGALMDRAGGAALNLPLPRGSDDGAFRLALDAVILPALQAFRPDAVVLQCGADAVTEDPLSRLACSNRAHLHVLRGLMAATDRLLVLGGGGYNPWTVGRLWAAVWGTIAGQDLPDRLPPEASDVLARLTWSRSQRPDPALLTTLIDAPRETAPTRDLRARVATLQSAIAAWA